MYEYSSIDLMFPQQGQGQAKVYRKENEIKSVKRFQDKQMIKSSFCH